MNKKFQRMTFIHGQIEIKIIRTTLQKILGCLCEKRSCLQIENTKKAGKYPAFLLYYAAILANDSAKTSG